MDQTHPCLYLVPMLTPMSTGDKECFCTITFERCTVCWIRFHCNHHLLEIRIPQAGRSEGRNAQRTTVLSCTVSSAESTDRASAARSAPDWSVMQTCKRPGTVAARLL